MGVANMWKNWNRKRVTNKPQIGVHSKQISPCSGQGERPFRGAGRSVCRFMKTLTVYITQVSPSCCDTRPFSRRFCGPFRGQFAP